MTSSQAAAVTGPGQESGLRDLRMVARQVRYEQLTFWLNPLAAVFTVGFSVIFLVLLGASAGSSRVHILGNIKLIQYYVPGFVAYGVMSA
jgi:ABC-2 type transport system permease protein